ncbi:MAG: hypothetical protein CMH50_10900 [Myxococcales bacterium]|nr:hypothetical protein [Myxococcales bacterium]
MRGLSSALLLTLLACPSPTPPAPVDAGPVALPCVQNQDCNDGERCSQNGQCEVIPPCSEDSECARYEYCSRHEQVCRTRDGFGNECEEDAQCGLSRFCALGLCRDAGEGLPCARRADCPVGQDCDQVHFYCIPSVGCDLAELFPETACEPGENCHPVSGRCQRDGAAECTEETQIQDCASGEFCYEGSCVQCVSDENCGPGLRCNHRSGFCESENICRRDEDCDDSENQYCDLITRMCLPRPDPCTSDLHCSFSERCDVITGLCEPLEGPCRDDIHEENDSFASATPLVFETDQLRMDHLALCPDDDDFFAVFLNRGDRLEVQLTDLRDGARIDVYLVAPDGISTLRYVPGPPRGSAGFDFVAGSDAFYYIKVAHLQGNTPYALELRVGPGQPCEDDLLEPNNEREEPQPLQAGTQNNLSLCQFDVDYYSVSLAAGEALEYTARFNAQQGDLDLRLINSDDQVLTVSRNVGSDEERLYHRAAGPEDLLIEVRTADRQSMTYSHDVVIHGPFLCEPDANEANDTAETATETNPDQGARQGLSLCAGDVDWYRIGLAAGQRLYATTNFEASELNVDVRFYDRSGTTPLGADWGLGGLHEAVFQADEQTQVLARVHSADDGLGLYRLDFQVDPAFHCRPDPAEPNNNPETAAPLPFDQSFVGGACDGDDDWFRLDVNQGDRVRLLLQFHAVDGDLDLGLRSTDRTTLITSSEDVGSQEEIIHRFPVTGTYYLRVYSIDTHPRARYILSAERL